MGALGFEFRRRAFCTVHTMNVKQTVHLRELIRQELTVRDALEKVCVDYAQGGMDERRKKNLLKDIKVCGQALSNIAAEHDEQASSTRGSFGSKVVQAKLVNAARRLAGGDMKSLRQPLVEVKAMNAQAVLKKACIGELVTPVRSKRKQMSSSSVTNEKEVMMPAKGQIFTPQHALTHLSQLSDSLRAQTIRAWSSDSANVIPVHKSSINKRLKLLKNGQLEKAFKPWNDVGRHNLAASSELKQWVDAHKEGATFGDAEMRQFLETKHGQEVSSKTVKNYVAHAIYFSEAVTERAKFKQASRLTAEQSLRRPQAYAGVLLNTMILPGPSLCGGPQPPKVCVCVCVKGGGGGRVCGCVWGCVGGCVHVCGGVGGGGGGGVGGGGGGGGGG